jgi:hypothetical protein
MELTWRGPVPRGAALPVDSAWEVLDRFGVALARCEHPRDQVRLALDAVRDGLAADAVLWHTGSGNDFALAGDPALSADWAAAFVGHVVGASDSAVGADRLVCRFLDPAARPFTPWPTSAALVRISRTDGSWLAALSFHPRRLFGSTDLHMMALTRRLLLNHRQQAQANEKLRRLLAGRPTPGPKEG